MTRGPASAAGAQPGRPPGRGEPGGTGATREQRLVETFVDLADTLVEDFDVIDFLHTLADRCVRLLYVEAAGIMLIDQHGRLHAAAASAENAQLLELLELQRDAGPCVDCCRTGIPVINADLDAEPGRWPRWSGAARAAGFTTVHALPLRWHESVIGALNLFCGKEQALSDDHARTGQAMADVATMGILAQRTIHQSGLLAAQLEQALSSRVVIEQAKGVLAERRHITVDTAFTVLRDYARTNNRRLSDVARDVVGGSWTVSDRPREQPPAT